MSRSATHENIPESSKVRRRTSSATCAAMCTTAAADTSSIGRWTSHPKWDGRPVSPAFRQQLAVLTRTVTRPQLGSADRPFWILLAKGWRDWCSALIIGQPDTVDGVHILRHHADTWIMPTTFSWLPSIGGDKSHVGVQIHLRRFH